MKSTHIRIRISQEEKEAWLRFAGNVSLSVFVRTIVNCHLAIKTKRVRTKKPPKPITPAVTDNNHSPEENKYPEYFDLIAE